jgi:phosphoribosylformylglycinamidine cyclo-ligase
MKRTFNNGIGMIAIVPEQVTSEVVARLRGMDEKVFIIGEIVKRSETGPRIDWVENDACRAQ